MQHFSQCIATIIYYTLWWRQLNWTQNVSVGYLNKPGKNNQDADGLSCIPLIENPNIEYTETISPRFIHAIVNGAVCQSNGEWPWAASLACTAEVFELMKSEGEKVQSIPLEELIKAQMTDKDICPVINLVKDKSRLSEKVMAGLSTASRRLLRERERNCRSTRQDSSSGWYKDQMVVNDYRQFYLNSIGC